MLIFLRCCCCLSTTALDYWCALCPSGLLFNYSTPYLIRIAYFDPAFIIFLAPKSSITLFLTRRYSPTSKKSSRAYARWASAPFRARCYPDLLLRRKNASISPRVSGSVFKWAWLVGGGLARNNVSCRRVCAVCVRSWCCPKRWGPGSGPGSNRHFLFYNGAQPQPSLNFARNPTWLSYLVFLVRCPVLFLQNVRSEREDRLAGRAGCVCFCFLVVHRSIFGSFITPFFVQREKGSVGGCCVYFVSYRPVPRTRPREVHESFFY